MRRYVTFATSAFAAQDLLWSRRLPAASSLASGGHGLVRGKRMICEAFLVEPPGGPPVS